MRLQVFCKNLLQFVENPKFSGFFPHKYVKFVNISYTKMVNFPIFWKNRIKCPKFSEYSAHKTLKLCNFLGECRIFGIFISIDSVFSILFSEYPNFLESSPPNTDYNPKIIRFYQFFGVIDNYPHQK